MNNYIEEWEGLSTRGPIDRAGRPYIPFLLAWAGKQCRFN